jgi:predicted branched-subunit amino acid permease
MSPEPEPSPAAPDWKSPALAGIRDALLYPAWVVALSVVGVGSLARDVGYPVGTAVLSTLLVWAGPSQVIFFASVAAGAAWSGIALAIGFASLRFLPMTVALLPLLRRPGQSIWQQLMFSHYVAVTVWSESLRRLPKLSPEERVPYYVGFANTCILLSAAGTYAGYYLVGALPVALAAGLLCLTPIFFLASLAAGIRQRGDVLAIVLGLLLAPLMSELVGGNFDLVVAGLIGGTVAFLLRRKGPRP